MTESVPEEDAFMRVDLFLTRQTVGPEENQLSCMFCFRGHGVEWETCFRPEGTGKIIGAGVCERCRTRLSARWRPPSGSDEQAAVYYRALEELTCLIEPADGAEDCPPVWEVLRSAIAFVGMAEPGPVRDDTIRCLQVLKHRFEEVLDREDLDL